MFSAANVELSMATYADSLFRSIKVAPMAEWRPGGLGPVVCVGNGPSLTPEDLTEVQLLNLPSFGCNYINRIYDKTVWRPTYWVATELLDSRWGAWHAAQGYECYMNANRLEKVEAFRSPVRFKGNENVHYLAVCPHQYRRWDSPDKPKRLHLPDVCLYGSSGHASIQLAILFGYNPVVLLGHDCRLLPRPRPVHEDPRADPNHFDAGYDTEYDLTAGLAERWVRTWHDMHNLIAKEAEDLGVKILNATRGGELESYDRIDFDRIQEVL